MENSEEEAWDTYLMRILPWVALWYTLGYQIPNEFPDLHPNIKGEFDRISDLIHSAQLDDRAFEPWQQQSLTCTLLRTAYGPVSLNIASIFVLFFKCR